MAVQPHDRDSRRQASSLCAHKRQPHFSTKLPSVTVLLALLLDTPHQRLLLPTHCLLFSAGEIRSAYLLSPVNPPSLNEIILLIAQLGSLFVRKVMRAWRPGNLVRIVDHVLTTPKIWKCYVRKAAELCTTKQFYAAWQGLGNF